MARRLSLLFLTAIACGAPKQEAPPPVIAPVEKPVEAPKKEEKKEPERLGLFKPVVQDNLLARTLFTGNPTYAQPRVSPDGKWIAHLEAVDGVMNLWVGPFDQPDKAQPLTQIKDRPLNNFSWTYDSRSILYRKDSGGNENFHLYAVDIKDKKIRDLTDLPNVRAELVELSAKKPGKVLVMLNARDPKFHDLFEIDIRSGKRTQLFENKDGYLGYVADQELKLRLLAKTTADGGMELFDPKGASFTKIPMEDSMTTETWSFDASGKTLYMVESRGRNTAAVVALDMATKKSTVIGEDSRADIDAGIFEPKSGKLLAHNVNYQRMEWKAVDPSIEGDLKFLREKMKGDFRVLSQSMDNMRWTIQEQIDDGSPKLFFYDKKTQTLSLLGYARKGLENIKLAKVHPQVIKSRDHMDLVSYVTMLPIFDPDGDGRPERPMPMVLVVHGGPWGRDVWGFNSTDQWLASRGYVVMRVNFRGSTGFGKAFVNAANGEWGRNMHNDLLDAVNWAIKEKIAEPTRVAIYGGSYGGYSVLAGLTMTPEVFACGVDIVGPSNLVTLLSTIPPYWEPQVNMFITRIGGDHRTEEGKKYLASRSPLSFADKIVRPLLIGQGANDPRVKQAESDQIAKAMQDKKIPVTYVLFSDEGHGFARPENRLAFDAVSEAFLAQCIGGPYQPIGSDFTGSTIAVKTGETEIVGLAEALRARN